MRKLTILLVISIFSLSTLFGQVNLTKNLVGYWSFDDSTAKDNSGNGLNGTLKGSPTSVSGISGRAFYFNGTSDYIKIGNQSSLNLGIGKAWSISAWFKTDTNDNFTGSKSIRPILSKRTNSSGNTDYMIYKENGKLYWGTGDASNTGCWQSITEPSKGNWHHIVVTLDYNSSTYVYTKKIYLDCQLKSTVTGTDKNGTVSDPFMIAYSYDGNVGATLFYGSIDEVRVYSRVITTDEMNSLCNPNYTLSGIVKTSNGNALKNSNIRLVKYKDSDSTTLVISTCKTDSSGFYTFKVTDSISYLLAEPDSATYPYEIPAWADSARIFQDATQIFAMKSSHSTAVNFHTFSGYNPGGKGYIGGKIYWCKGCKTDIFGNPIANLKLLLIDNKGKAVTFTKTNSKGYFGFKNLKDGTYKIFVDKPLIDNSLAPQISINSEATSDSLKFTLHPDHLELKSTTGFEETTLNAGFNIYPNPVNNSLNIAIPHEYSKDQNQVSIYNETGQLLISEKIVNQTTFDMNPLPKGLYLVIIKCNGLKTYSNKIIKE